MIRCSNCGSNNPDENSFCEQCGSRLDSSRTKEREFSEYTNNPFKDDGSTSDDGTTDDQPSQPKRANPNESGFFSDVGKSIDSFLAGISIDEKNNPFSSSKTKVSGQEPLRTSNESQTATDYQERSDSPIICNACGQENPHKNNYCKECGARLYGFDSEKSERPAFKPPVSDSSSNSAPNTRQANGSRHSTLSVFSFVFSFFCCFSVVGVILAIIDLVRAKDESPKKEHTFSYLALFIGGILTIAYLFIYISSLTPKTNYQKPENTVSTTIEVSESTDASIDESVIKTSEVTETSTEDTNNDESAVSDVALDANYVSHTYRQLYFEIPESWCSLDTSAVFAYGDSINPNCIFEGSFAYYNEGADFESVRNDIVSNVETNMNNDEGVTIDYSDFMVDDHNAIKATLQGSEGTIIVSIIDTSDGGIVFLFAFTSEYENQFTPIVDYILNSCSFTKAEEIAAETDTDAEATTEATTIATTENTSNKYAYSGDNTYYIIDLDEKKVYNFFTFDTDPYVGTCSGNLDSGLTVTYNLDGDTVTETIYWSGSGDSKICVIDSYGYDWYYNKTSYSSAVALMD